MARLCRSLAKWMPLLLLAWAASGITAAVNAADLVFELRIEGGFVPAAQRLIRVTQGDKVTLRWRTDEPMVLHLHGYDIEKRVEPGSVAEMTFDARATGRFPIVAHAFGTAGRAHEEIALAHVEVYPN